MTPLKLITEVRRRLNGPLAQSPSPRVILDRALAEYRNAVIGANNSGNAWAVNEYTLTATADTRRYEITAADFSKALLIATVPAATGPIEPEMPLEFTQLERLPEDWAFLRDVGYWSLWWASVSQKARFAAFYRQKEAAGFKNYIEIRPTPDAGEQYRVLYQVGDFTGSVTSDLDFALPFPELDFYFVTLIADALLPYTRWSNDKNDDGDQLKMLAARFQTDLARYQKTYDDWIASLSVGDIVYADSYADSLGIY